MYVPHLALTDSVPIRRPTSSSEPGPTSFVGRNGGGKTNLVEALGYLATLASHRVASDAPLVRLGAERAIVRGAVVPRTASCCVEMEIARHGQPGPAGPGPGDPGPRHPRRTADGAVRAGGSGPGPRATRPNAGGSSTRCWSLRAPRSPGCGRTTSGSSSSATRCSKTAGPPARRSRPKDLATLDVWDTHLAQPAPSSRTPGWSCWSRCARMVAGCVRRGRAERKGDGPIEYKLVCRSSRGTRPLRERSARGAHAEAASRTSAEDELDRGVSWSGRTGTTWCCCSGTCPRRGTPATVSRGRSRWRCGWRRSSCSGRTGLSRC